MSVCDNVFHQGCNPHVHSPKAGMSFILDGNGFYCSCLKEVEKNWINLV